MQHICELPKYQSMVNYHLINDQGHVQQLTGRLGWTIGTACLDRSVNRCHFVLRDYDESCPTADLSRQAVPMVRPIRPVSC